VGVGFGVTHLHAFLLQQVFKVWRGCHRPLRSKGQWESLPHLGCGFLAFTQASAARCLLGGKLSKAALLFVCIQYLFYK